MTIINIDDIKDIEIEDYAGTRICFEQSRGETTRLEISTSDAKYLLEKLKEHFE